MKKIKIIENPVSGKSTVSYSQKKINLISNMLLDRGYIIHKFQTKGKNDAENEAIKSCEEDWDAIIVSGGDGTVNEVVSGIAKSSKKIPLGILAEGTVNDFATIMKIPTEAKDFCDMIDNWKSIGVDLGKFKDSYFMNVGAFGFLTNVAHSTPRENKNILGKVAYFLEGIKEFPKQISQSIKVKITSEEYTSKQEEDLLMFFISNTSSIGGFKNAIPVADATDGYLDCLIVEKTEDPQEILDMLIKMVNGNHIESPKIKHFQTKKIHIDCLSEESLDIDIDGEYAGTFPATFEVIENAFQIFTP